VRYPAHLLPEVVATLSSQQHTEVAAGTAAAARRVGEALLPRRCLSSWWLGRRR
jgi:hypothetical protein